VVRATSPEPGKSPRRWDRGSAPLATTSHLGETSSRFDVTLKPRAARSAQVLFHLQRHDQEMVLDRRCAQVSDLECVLFHVERRGREIELPLFMNQAWAMHSEQ
jgi:hypothetical protein